MAKKKLEVGENSEIIIDERLMREKIYIIRGQKVMLDYDLAEIYGYTTSAFNRQVKRNIEKFEGEDFMFQLTREEVDFFVRCHFGTSRNGSDDFVNLKCKNCTSSWDENGKSKNLRCQNGTSSWGGIRYLPYAFTEQGIYMLMTVLRGELAIKQSRALIRMFKAMKDYIMDNQEQVEYRSNLQLAMKVTENTEDLVKMKNEVKKIDSEMVNINKKLDDTIKRSEISPILLDFGKVVEKREYIFMDGEPMKASEAYVSLYKKAKHSIYIIDDYISIKTLRHLSVVEPGIEIMIFSDNKCNTLHLCDYKDFQRERSKISIKFIRTNNKIHDRFVILDYGMSGEKIYHAGASEKDAGKKMTSVTRFDDELVKNALHDVVERLKKNSRLVLK